MSSLVSSLTRSSARFGCLLLAALPLWLAACQAVTDFPKTRGEDSGSASQTNGAGGRDRPGGIDAGELQTPAQRPDASADEIADEDADESVDAAVDERLSDAEQGAGPVDAAVSGSCEPTGNLGCAASERCVATSEGSRCVRCASDVDCVSAPLLPYCCVANDCVQCDRGALPEDAADDRGCADPALPICSASGRCAACQRTPDNCPGELRCNGELGCLACDVEAAVGSNGCVAATPVCRLAGGSAACAGCLVDAECGAGGFCHTPSGTCTRTCDPEGPLGDNGCTGATPYCTQAASGFACTACTPTSCTGTTPLCAVSGPRTGSCVACRADVDCALDAQRPVCDVAMGACRARGTTDCTGATPVLVNGRCVECMSDLQCASAAGRPYCDSMSNLCVACSALPSAGCSARSPATPFCSATTGACAACLRNSDCSAVLTPKKTPICLNSTCVACNAPGVANPESVCTAELGGLSCVVSGPEAGRCGLLPTLPLPPPPL
jgi:hypothetical protein